MDCESEFERILVGGWREGVLAGIVEEYKYQAVWALGDVLVDVLDVVLERYGVDEWGKDVVIVPLPTIGRHVRERGLDHTLKLAQKLAKRHDWQCEQALVRAADTVQVGAKAEERQEQARKAYAVCKKLSDEKIYLLLDDVWTTGASMRAAAIVMRAAGAKRLIGGVIAVGRSREDGS